MVTGSSAARKAKKKPLRTCIACGLTSDKTDLIRFVRSSDGIVSIDETGKAPGRGAYLCASEACFHVALRKRSLSRALRVMLDEGQLSSLERSFNETCARRVTQDEGHAR